MREGGSSFGYTCDDESAYDDRVIDGEMDDLVISKQQEMRNKKAESIEGDVEEGSGGQEETVRIGTTKEGPGRRSQPTENEGKYVHHLIQPFVSR